MVDLSMLWRLRQIRFPLALLLVGILTLLAAPAHAQSESGITSPAPGSAIFGDVPIFGTATIDPFQKYELHFKQDPSGDDAFIYFAGGTSPVIGGQLGVWQAGGLPPGTYTLRLRVVKAGDVALHRRQAAGRQQRHPVVGLLAKGLRRIARILQGLKREFVVGALELLQPQHIDRVGRQPVDHMGQARRQRVHVPGS